MMRGGEEKYILVRAGEMHFSSELKYIRRDSYSDKLVFCTIKRTKFLNFYTNGRDEKENE